MYRITPCIQRVVASISSGYAGGGASLLQKKEELKVWRHQGNFIQIFVIRFPWIFPIFFGYIPSFFLLHLVTIEYNKRLSEWYVDDILLWYSFVPRRCHLKRHWEKCYHLRRRWRRQQQMKWKTLSAMGVEKS